MGHFLAWLLSQLCNKAEDVPQHICNLFQSDCRPQSDDLMKAIKTMSLRFSKILVSVDAVDESQKREALAEFLKRLATQYEFKCFHVVVTSRREADIERHLGIFTALSMSNELVDRDIANYLDDQLQTDRALQRFSSKLRDGIKESLLSRANGMFRLVVCQLQVLKKTPRESTAWETLEQLPETLDETYERILVGVPLEWTHIVRRALCLLSCISSVPIKELVSFASEDHNEYTLSEKQGCELSEEAFEEVMGCLMSISTTDKLEESEGSDESEKSEESDRSDESDKPEERRVRLAHYTIKEYLESPRIARSSASFFYLSTSEAISYLVKSMFRVQICERDDVGSWRTFKIYCREEFPNLLRMGDTAIASSKELTALVSSAMDPRMPYYESMFNRAYHFDFGSWLEEYKETVPPEWPEISILVNLITKGLYATVTAVLLQYTPEQVSKICSCKVDPWNDTSLIAWLARTHQYDYLLLFLQRCGPCLRDNTESLLIWALEIFSRSDMADETLSSLVSAKVPVNPGSVRVTPLQLAVSHLQFHDVKVLLENGADPNAVGCPDGWMPYKLRFFEGGLSPLSKLRQLKSGTSLSSWSLKATTYADGIEELLVNAGGREFQAWRVGDLKQSAPCPSGGSGLRLSADGNII